MNITGWKHVAEKLHDAVFLYIEEEESETFPGALMVFKQEEAVAMGEAFEQLKPELFQDGFVKSSVDMVINLMPPRLADKVRESRT